MLILIFIIILRIPSLFEPHRYADEEIYLTLGLGVRKGLVLYRDIHDNKPPFLYITAAIAHDLFWFRLILLVVQGLGVAFFWKLAEAVFEKRRRAVVISTSLFGVFSTLPFLEGNVANGENFMIVPTVLAAFLLFNSIIEPAKPRRRLVYFLIGLLFACGFLYKVPVAFDFIGLLVFWWLLSKPEIRLRERLKFLVSERFWLVVTGFAGPIILSIVYYTLKGAFEPYVRSALLQNIGYLSSWQSGGNGILSNPLVWRGLVVAGIVIGTLILSRKISLTVRFVVIWTAFSLYGALLSSRPYPHYLLEPLVPFSLLVVIVLTQRSFINLAVSVAMVVLVVASYFQNGFWYYGTLGYYRNFIQFASGFKSWEDYLAFWGVKRNYEISEYLKQRSLPSDRIFVWGTEPAIYVLSDRLPVGRYTVSYHIVDFKAFEETIAALRAMPPKYIVVVEDLDKFSELKSYLKTDFIYECDFDGVKIFRSLNR